MLFPSCTFLYAQDKPTPTETRHILIVDNGHDTQKLVNIGDKIRLILTNSKRIKGHVVSIDSTFFTIDKRVVHLEEIGKISTKKSWSQGVGGFFLAAGIGFMVAELATSTPESSIGPGDGAMAIIGLPLLIAGAAMVHPKYQQLGKSKWLVISSTPTVEVTSVL
jgi:small nuclear ribonucleoprotein (snRNP)-like protein